MIVCSLWTTEFYSFILYRPCIAFLSHLSSLLQFLKNNKKQQEQVTKKVFRMKTSACRDAWNPQKPAEQDGNDTTTHSHHPYIMCPFCQLCTTKNSLHTQPNEHGTQHCSLHSLPHKRQSISATFSSNKISQHNLKLPTYHTDPGLLTVSAYKTNYTSHAQYSNYIASTHNTTHSPCTSKCTPHPALPNPLPSTTLQCTQLTQGTVGKMAQDVGMVWMCCGVIPILFGWFLRVPSLHALVFIQKTFLWLYT